MGSIKAEKKQKKAKKMSRKQREHNHDGMTTVLNEKEGEKAVSLNEKYTARNSVTEKDDGTGNIVTDNIINDHDEQEREFKSNKEELHIDEARHEHEVGATRKLNQCNGNKLRLDKNGSATREEDYVEYDIDNHASNDDIIIKEEDISVDGVGGYRHETKPIPKMLAIEEEDWTETDRRIAKEEENNEESDN